MRWTLLILVAPLFGCAANSANDDYPCSSYIFEGTKVLGVVRISEYSEAEFLDQLPEEERDWQYCWLLNPDGSIALDATDVAHFFEHDGESWRYRNREEYLIIWHERKVE